jgi:hypothetical protein
VKDHTVITPEPRNILRGISRAYIFDLSRQLGLPCLERNIEPYDVITADEAFMTGTPFCMLPVTSLNGVVIGAGKMGEVTRRLLDAWSANVGVDIAGQIKKWDAERGGSDVSPSPLLPIPLKEIAMPGATNQIGIMQGRLSPPRSGRIQSFPLGTWRENSLRLRIVVLS